MKAVEVASPTSPTMPLLPEIWSIVLGFLHQPRPAPLFRPPRSAMCQPDLVQVMLTCRLFYDLSQPILYTHIHTDRLTLMLQSIWTPAMQLRFARTKSLHIEYREKAIKPTYVQILAKGGGMWQCLCLSPARQKALGMYLKICKAETEALAKAFRCVVSAGTQKVFPRLTTVTVSSVYGVDPGVWDAFDLNHGEENGPGTLGDSSDAFDRFLSSSSIQHLCIREPQAPLSITPIPSCGLNRAGHPYSRTFHFDHNVLRLPVPNLRPISWVSDVTPDKDWSNVLTRMGAAIDIARQMRKYQGTPYPTNIDIYGSSCYRVPRTLHPSADLFDLESRVDRIYDSSLTPNDQRRIAKQAGEAIQAFLRETSGVKDVVRFHPSADIAICVACGSGPPEEKMGRKRNGNGTGWEITPKP